MKMHFTKEWLKTHIENEPDGMIVEAGSQAMTKPSDKWMQKAQDLALVGCGCRDEEEETKCEFNGRFCQRPAVLIARALEATDKAATERAAQIGYATCAATRHVTLGREVEKNILAGDLEAAIRKGDSNEG